MIHVEHLAYRGRLWRWVGASGSGNWHFLTISGPAGEALSGTAMMRRMEGTARGFGSIRVRARIGESTFGTSVFPSKSDGAWLLPVKAAVRRAEGLADGDEVDVFLEV